MSLQFDCRHRFPEGFELNVRFETGDPCVAIFGPSGSGKTTILSLIAGTLKPHQGHIALADRLLTETRRGIHLRPESRGVGLVFQEPRLFPHRSVRQNLEFGQRWRRPGKRTVDIERVATVLEIQDLLNRSTESLSGGQKQRVALGRVIASGPDVLLMDEPLASLDEGLKLKLLNYLERLLDEWQLPAIYVTHSHVEARRLASRILLLEAGRLVAEGQPDEVFARVESLQASAFGAGLNLLRVDRVVRDGSTTFAWLGQQKLTLSPDREHSSSATDGQFVRFSPADVVVSRESVDGTSARNQLVGTVRQVATVGHSCFIAIDIGQIFWAVLTESSARELQLEPDSPVTCLIKAHNLSLVR